MSTRTLLDLSPSEFENLTYDLLLASGFRNLTWRTPGADGGRDIEGYISIFDAVGEEVRQRWYIECKRYQSSVDWPTVYSKIPYAVNHQADYLLMSSTSNPSPKCEDEISKWNKSNNLKIRFWRGYQLESLVKIKIEIGVKYGLVYHPSAASVSMKQISTLALKAAQSAESAHEFLQDPSFALQAASACAELVLQRTSEIEEYGYPVFMLSKSINLPEYIVADDGLGDLTRLD